MVQFSWWSEQLIHVFQVVLPDPCSCKKMINKHSRVKKHFKIEIQMLDVSKYLGILRGVPKKSMVFMCTRGRIISTYYI